MAVDVSTAPAPPKPRSIVSTISLRVLVVVFVVVGIFGVCQTLAQRQRLERDQARAISATAHRLAEMLWLPIYDYNREQISRSVNSVMNDRDLVAVVVRDGADGEVMVGRVRRDDGSVGEFYPGFELQNHSRLELPVMQDAVPLGAVQVYYTDEHLRSESLVNLLRWIGVLVALSVCIAIALVVALGRGIVRPIRQLEDDFRKVARGELELSIDVSRNDEIGRLAVSFSRLRDTIRYSIEDLNAEVAQRQTAELVALEARHRIERHLEATVGLLSDRALHRLGVNRILERIVEVAAESLRVPFGSIWLLESDPQRLRMQCHSSTEAIEAEPRRPEQISRYLSELAVLRAVAARDVSRDDRLVEWMANYFAPREIRATIHAPIRVSGQLIGVVQFDDCEVRAWHADEVAFAAGIADQAAAAVVADEQRRVEEELRIREADLRITLESIADAVIATDREGRVVRLNPVAEALVGVGRQDAIGRRLGDVLGLYEIGAGTGDMSPIDLLARVRDGEPPRAQPVRQLLVSRGQRIDVEASVAAIRGVSGEALGAVVVVRNVAEQVRLEERLRQSQKMESVGQLAGGIAHDFNNMLTGILGAAELLHGLVADRTEGAHLLGIIEASASRATELTRKLLDFSRKGRRISTVVAFDRIVSDTVDIVKRSIDRRIELVVVSDAKRATVIGDPAQLQSALLNLAINARDAMPEGGCLEIRVDDVRLGSTSPLLESFGIESGDYLRVRVTDTGTGIPPELAANVFEPFFTTKEVGKGTGLGLAAVYGTIQEHGGAIELASAEGEGTTFTLYLPLTDEVPSEESPPQRWAESGSGLVLIAEDEPIVRDLVRSMLERMGYDVIVTKDGQECLDEYRRRASEIDVVVLDSVMPRKGGIDTFREIRTIDPDARVVLCSGYTHDIDVDQLIERGLVAFLAKPYGQADLAQALALATEKA